MRTKPERGTLTYEGGANDLDALQKKYFDVMDNERKNRQGERELSVPIPFLYKIILSRSSHKKFIQYAHAIGMRKYKMYPEIDKLAQDITKQAL